MSYAIRNTIILIIVSAAMMAGGWSYIHFVQEKQISEMKVILRKKQQKLQNDKGIADRYNNVINELAKKRLELKSFNKTIPVALNGNKLYDYLNMIRSGGDNLDINFTYLKNQKVPDKDYGIVKANISGQGNYRDLYRLISNIETSSPIVKIHNLVVNPIDKQNKYSDVNFTFEIDGYYSDSQKGNEIPSKIVQNQLKIVRNPFYPLIRGIKPNTFDRPDVEKSKLVGIGKNVIYIIDQHGKVRILHIDDKVYLGKLVSASIKKQTATFALNKGGIADTVVLKLNSSENKQN